MKYQRAKRRAHTFKEARAIVILRRKGHSLQTIARVLRRSLSYIHQVISFNRSLPFGVGLPKFYDLRKSPNSNKSTKAVFKSKVMEKLMIAWQAYLDGESDEPP